MKMIKQSCIVLLVSMVFSLQIKFHQIENDLAQQSFQIEFNYLEVGSINGLTVTFSNNTVTFRGCLISKAPYSLSGHNSINIGSWGSSQREYNDEYLLRKLLSKAASYQINGSNLTFFDKIMIIILKFSKKSFDSATLGDYQKWIDKRFQYRTIEPISSNIESNLVDLYFFKPNITSVGVKGRFQRKDCSIWESDTIQLKFIQNLKQIETATTYLEQWVKIYIPISIEIPTKQYILAHPKLYKIHQRTKIQQIIEKQLQKMNNIISNAIKTELQRHNYPIKDTLQQWVNKNQPLIEIYSIEKTTKKINFTEQGQLTVSSLYSDQKPTAWKTFQLEAPTETALKKKLQQNNQGAQENISYPKLMQAIYLNSIT